MKDAVKYLLFVLCCVAVFGVIFFMFTRKENAVIDDVVLVADEPATQAPTQTAPVVEIEEAAVPEPTAQTRQGSFEDRVHNGEGTVKIITENGVRKVLFSENFATESGPDLFVYMTDTSPIQTSQDVHAGKLADLGRLQNITGAQEYLIPDDVTFDINSVTVYCVAYKVVYTTATIQ